MSNQTIGLTINTETSREISHILGTVEITARINLTVHNSP